MEAHQLVDRQLETAGRRLEVEAELRVVATGQLDRARRRQDPGGRLRNELGDRRAQSLVADGARVVVDEQRGERRHRLDDAGEALLLDEELERADAGIDVYADVLAELDGDCEIARRPEPQRARSPTARSSAHP